VKSPVFAKSPYLGRIVPEASAAVAVTETAGAPYFEGHPKDELLKMQSQLALVQIVAAFSVLVVASAQVSQSVAGYFHY